MNDSKVIEYLSKGILFFVANTQKNKILIFQEAFGVIRLPTRN